MRITVDFVGLTEAQKELTEAFSARRMRAAVSTALTRTARIVGDEWTGQMRARFDRPTRATENAVVTKMATAQTLEADVRLKDEAGAGGVAPVEWLYAHELGGARNVKKFERALAARGTMPAGMSVVPGPDAQLDVYGNVTRGQIVQVLAQLGAQYSPGYARVISPNEAVRKTKARATGRVYFALPAQRGKLGPGIYVRQRGQPLGCVFRFVVGVRYPRRTALRKRAAEIVQREFAAQFRRAVGDSYARLVARDSRR